MANKIEIKYILYSMIFAAAWFMFILPMLIDKFKGTSPFIEFILFNVGLIVLLQIFLKSWTLKAMPSMRITLGIICIFIALDILQPPYVVLKTGELISEGPLLVTSSSDYIAGLIAGNLGLTGIMKYLFTYVLAPIVLLFSAAKLIPNFVREI